MTDSPASFTHVIEGQDLLRQPVQLPADLPPGPCILLFAFSPGHQSEAITWVTPLRDLALGGKAAVRQVIVLPAFAKLGERMVMDQLLKSVPEEARPGTILAFTDPGAVAKAAGAPDAHHIALALLDQARTITWTASGDHTPAAETALRTALGA